MTGLTGFTSLEDWLAEEGFRPENAWLGTVKSVRRGTVRVAWEDHEHLTVYVFDPGKSQVMRWEATFAAAPDAVVIAAVRYAMDEAAADRLPTN